MSSVQTSSAIDRAIRLAAAAFARGAPAEAERMARQILSEAPRHPTALQMVGVALLMQGKPKDAVAPLRDARSQRPDTTVDVQLATALRLTGEFAEAEKLLRPALEKTPSPTAFHELAALLHATRRFKEADEVAARGLAAAPQMPDLWIVSGMSRLDCGDRVGARRQLDRALSIVPDHPRALHGLGVAYLEDGEFGKAADLFQRAVNTGQAPAQSFVSLARCFFELGKQGEAIECLRRGVAMDPTLYSKAVKTLVMVSRGQFSLKPSEIAALLTPDQRLADRN